MGIMSLILKLFGADVAAPPDAMKLDGTTEATLAHSVSGLPPNERGWISFAEARILFSTKGSQYAFVETDQDGRRNIESFAARTRPSSTLCWWRGGSISHALNLCDVRRAWPSDRRALELRRATLPMDGSLTNRATDRGFRSLSPSDNFATPRIY